MTAGARWPGAEEPVPEGAEHTAECRRDTPYGPWTEATECCRLWWEGPKHKAARAAAAAQKELDAAAAALLPPEPPGPNAWLSGYGTRAAEQRAAEDPPEAPRRYGIFRDCPPNERSLLRISVSAS